MVTRNNEEEEQEWMLVMMNQGGEESTEVRLKRNESFFLAWPEKEMNLTFTRS